MEVLGDLCDVQYSVGPLGACWDDAHRISLIWMMEMVFQFLQHFVRMHEVRRIHDVFVFFCHSFQFAT